MQTMDRPAGRPGTRRSRFRYTDQAMCCLVQSWTQRTRVLGGSPSGLVAQLVEHPLCKRGASGSNPDESMGAIPAWTSKERPRQINIRPPPLKMADGNALDDLSRQQACPPHIRAGRR